MYIHLLILMTHNRPSLKEFNCRHDCAFMHIIEHILNWKMCEGKW